MPILVAKKLSHFMPFVSFVSSLACIFDVGGLENALVRCIDPRFINIHFMKLEPHRLVIRARYTDWWPENTHTHTHT